VDIAATILTQKMQKSEENLISDKLVRNIYFRVNNKMKISYLNKFRM